MDMYDYSDLADVLHDVLSPKPSDFYDEDPEDWADDAIPDPAPDDWDDDVEW